MSDVRARLEAYRRKRAEEETSSRLAKSGEDDFDSAAAGPHGNDPSRNHSESEHQYPPTGSNGTRESGSFIDSYISNHPFLKKIGIFFIGHPWAFFVLKLLLWLILLGIFAELQFGSVFVVVSLFFVVLTNLRTSPRKPGELSAYSVFNENCERLPGQLTAEQFENEIRRGPI